MIEGVTCEQDGRTKEGNTSIAAAPNLMSLTAEGFGVSEKSPFKFQVGFVDVGRGNSTGEIPT